MKRMLYYPVVVWAFGCLLPQLLQGADIYSAQSGNWGSVSTWVGGVIPGSGDDVTILGSHIIVVESGGKSCQNLTINNGGKLFANNSNTGSNPRYINLYGNILCEGQIGNGETYDLIGFNIEGESCSLAGNGIFDASRIRKNDNVNSTSTVGIYMNIRLRYGGTALYNNRSGTVFHVIIEAGDTLAVPGNGTTAGNVAMDGINGAGSTTGGGTISVSGTLIISGILFLTNSNSANPVSVTIHGGGLVETGSINCPNSGASGHSFTIAGGGQLTLMSGDWGEIGFTNNTYTFHVGSTVEYSGDTAQTVGNPTNYHHLVLSGTGTKTLSADMTVGGNLTIEEGASLKIGAGMSVSVTGTCSLSGAECLVLKSPLDSGATASFIPYGSVTGSGTVRIERFIKKYLSMEDSRYHMLSSPVTAQNIQPEFVGDPPDPGVDFYRWGEPEGYWVNCKDDSGNWDTSFQAGDNRTFIPGTGYLVAYPEDELKHFTGTLNTGDLTPDITYTEGDFAGFNLTGNPYSSALNGEIHNWGKSDVDNAIWVWDGEAGNYKSWNGSVGTLTGGIIPAMQGFFVHANGPDPLLTIPALFRVHAAQPFYKELPSNTLQLTLQKEGLSDGVVIQLSDTASPGYDPGVDVLKLFGFPQAPQLFVIEEETYLSISILPEAETVTTIPLGLIAGTSGDHLITAEGTETFLSGTDIFLEDQLEQEVINLRITPEYTFSAMEGFDSGRFVVRFGNPAGETESASLQGIAIRFEANRILIHGLAEETPSLPVRVFDPRGALVYLAKVDATCPVIETELPARYYLVTVTSGKRTISEKVFLNKSSY